MKHMGLYNAALPALADGQQAPLQLDNFGRLIVSAGSGSPGAAGGAVQSVQGVPGGLPLPVAGGAPTSSPYTAVPVAVAAAGDTTVVAGHPGQTIRVFALALSFAAPVDVTVKDGGTTLGTFQGVTALQLEPLLGHPRWVTQAGNGLRLHLAAAVAGSGALWITQG